MDKNIEIQTSKIHGALSNLMYEIDDWCPTPPRPPWGNDLGDALVAVAVHNLATRIANKEIRHQIQNMAESLYTSAGMKITK